MHKAAASSLVCAGLLGLALLPPRTAGAAWPSDPGVNVPLCTAAGNQQWPTSVPDGAGGAIVVWDDYRSGDYDIYAQRISADGTVQWTADGVPLCTAAGNQYAYPIVSDGAGGAIVTWMDQRSGSWDIYTQRVSATGAVQWTADGVALCTATGDQSNPMTIGDGTHGAIVTWYDDRGGGYDIYAQRISAAGAPQWTANGAALCTNSGTQWYPTIAADNSGGAIVAWEDWRSDYGNIYAQRLSAAGAPQWTANGVSVCANTGQQSYPTILADGSGGAIVAWADDRNSVGSGNWDIYAQRISGAGAPQWAANGVAICTATGEQWAPTAVSDGASGVIVTWYDLRGANYDVYAQRISAAGTPQWTANGAALCTAVHDQINPAIVSDGAGGAIATWQDSRSGAPKYSLYAQRISAAGTTQWPANGVAICTNNSIQEYTNPTIIPDGASGAIISWDDYRSGTNYDIYAQRIRADGSNPVLRSPEGDASLVFALEPVSPNPLQGGALTVRFTLPSAAPARVEMVDVSGRRVVEREVGSLGAGHHSLDLADGRRLAPGLYLVRLTQGANTRVRRVAVL